jgi:acyl-CoA thioester hydrolase
MNLESYRLKKDGSRFSIQHLLMRGDTMCAKVTVEGAWIDTIKRKLTVPPEVVFKAFDAMPKAEDFEWLD